MTEVRPLAAPRLTPWIPAALAYLLTAAGLVLAFPAARAGLGSLFITDILIAASFTTIGLLVSTRRPGDRIGLLFAAIGLLEGLTVAANHYALAGLTAAAQLPGTVWAGWLGYWVISLVVPVGLFLALLLLFPNGQPLSPRWGWLAIAGIVFSVLFAAGEILTLPRMEIAVGVPTIDNPTNVTSLTLTENAWVFGLAFLAFGVVGVYLRFRRSTGVERQQLRWFVFAVAASIGSMVVLLVTFFAIGAPEPEPAWFTVTVSVVPALGIGVGIPAACGVAVLRYRLWDLDFVIRKTVLYATVALFVMAVFAVAAVGVGVVVGRRGTAAVVAAALAGFAFWPVLRIARRVADRLVYGSRATPYEVLTRFSERMGEAFATDDVLLRMARILAEGTGAAVARVWLAVGSELRPAASHPAGPAPAAVPLYGPPPLGVTAVEVRDRGELLGALSVEMPPDDPMDPAKERLVRDLASQAGLVLRNVRLVDDLRRSRRRLVAAQDEERRRLERNIHDGAQQQLVALAVKARLARTLTERDPPKAAEMLTQIEAETQSALEDLRDLARGIYPPLLADKGLAAALEAQGRKSPMPVTVEADGLDRLPQEIEAAVYFSALEALQNTAKYAHASRATVTLRRSNGVLAFTVADDGTGFDPASTGYGTGLQGIADRLGALDGEVTVESSPGSGTSVTGRVPVRTSTDEEEEGA